MTNSDAGNPTDGIHALVPRDGMCEPARRLRRYLRDYAGARFVRKEFGFFTEEVWREQGLPADADWRRCLGTIRRATTAWASWGWCEAAFEPLFDVKVMRTAGTTRSNKTRRAGMCCISKAAAAGSCLEYGRPSRERPACVGGRCEVAAYPASPERYEDLEARMAQAKAEAARGMMMSQRLIRGISCISGA